MFHGWNPRILYSLFCQIISGNFVMLTAMKVSEILAMLRKDGWQLAATRGSHRQFKHPGKPGRVTLAGKPSDDLAPGTLNSIFKQAGLKE
jgi:predicted RNA binding protein YcfA (HicA-like mRNA interferase family)